MKTKKDIQEVENWKKANPFVLVNIQNSQALCGRYATQEEAINAAKRSGDYCGTEQNGSVVLYSSMPNL